mgnify:CR=1 FL=1
MANTYTQIHLQIVFAVKYRQALIHKSWRERLHSYTTGIVQNYGHKMLQINSQPDHIHILIGYRPSHPLPKLIEEIKTSSNLFINDNKLSISPFAWQTGYGAFSYSRSQVPSVAKYIERQDEHHQKKSFRAEYHDMLQKAQIEFDNQYLFEFWDDIISWE